VVKGDFSISSGTIAATRLLARRPAPTAVFCFNDEMAIGVMQTARRRGIRVPEDLSVVGFDDIRFARYLDPPSHDHHAAHARDRRGLRAPAARNPQRQPGRR
jgi:LacI family repressor for deo operon, udp, cdd, tsx, nupC, and nupG